MLIAVLSDIHDHLDKLDQAIQLIKANKVESLIYCGDFCAPFTAEKLNTLNLPTFACFGNNDEDHYAIVSKTTNWQFWSLTKEFAEVTLDNKKIAFCHYPKLASLLAATGEYAAVFHGHTHVPSHDQIGSTLLANPGAVCGLERGRTVTSTFGLYDTTLNQFEIIRLP